MEYYRESGEMKCVGSLVKVCLQDPTEDIINVFENEYSCILIYEDTLQA